MKTNIERQYAQLGAADLLNLRSHLQAMHEQLGGTIRTASLLSGTDIQYFVWKYHIAQWKKLFGIEVPYFHEYLTRIVPRYRYGTLMVRPCFQQLFFLLRYFCNESLAWGPLERKNRRGYEESQDEAMATPPASC